MELSLTFKGLLPEDYNRLALDKVSPESSLVDSGDDKHFHIKKYRKKANPFTDGPGSTNTIEGLFIRPGS